MTAPLAISPADALALTMVLLLGFSLGMILTILVVMARHAGRKPDLTAEFEESEPDDRESPTRAGDGPEEPGEEWERAADWWKK